MEYQIYKMLGEFDGVECRNIVNDDIYLTDLVTNQVLIKMDSYNTLIAISKYQKDIIDQKIEKIAQNKVKISFNANLRLKNKKQK